MESVYDFAVGIGIKPLVELSYCPKLLKGNCSLATDVYKGWICAPQLNGSYAAGNVEYARMVTDTVKHLVLRYGLEEVRSWRFEGECSRSTVYEHSRSTVSQYNSRSTVYEYSTRAAPCYC
jgi:xylan 1,4-beta-xylosidase